MGRHRRSFHALSGARWFFYIAGYTDEAPFRGTQRIVHQQLAGR